MPSTCDTASGRKRKTGPLSVTHPDTARLLRHADDAIHHGVGYKGKLDFVCPVDEEHRWFVAPQSVANGHGCSVCTNKVVQAGKNDLNTVRPDLTAHLLDPGVGSQVGAGSHKKVWWKCLRDSRHEPRLASVASVASGNGCGVCSGRKVQRGVNDLWTTHPTVARRLADPEVGYLVSAGTNRKVEWRCLVDDRHPNWSSPPNAARETSRHGGCRTCQGHLVVRGVNDLWTTHPAVAALLIDPSVGLEVTSRSQRIADWKCPVDDRHETGRTSIANRTAGNGCAICGGRKIQAGINDLWTVAPALAGSLVDAEIGKTVGSHSEKKVEWRCDLFAEHTWMATPSARSAGRGCPPCAKSGFKVDKPAFFYVLRALDVQGRGEVLKYGVSNSRKVRIAKHRAVGLALTVAIYEAATGRIALDLEQTLKRGLLDAAVPSCSSRGMTFDGSTEAHLLSDLPLSTFMSQVNALVAGTEGLTAANLEPTAVVAA